MSRESGKRRRWRVCARGSASEAQEREKCDYSDVRLRDNYGGIKCIKTRSWRHTCACIGAPASAALEARASLPRSFGLSSALVTFTRVTVARVSQSRASLTLPIFLPSSLPSLL